MSVYRTIVSRRTIRKFKQQKIERAILEKLVDAARLAPSAMNLQPLKYGIVDEESKVSRFFQFVKWAGYIAPAGNPAENEKPVAYLVVLVDTRIRKSGFEEDIGAAIQNILLAAEEEGIGTCWMGAIDRDAIRELLKIPEHFIINSVISMGYKAENPVYEDENGSIRYYKDENGVLHVPKRKLDEVIVSFD